MAWLRIAPVTCTSWNGSSGAGSPSSRESDVGCDVGLDALPPLLYDGSLVEPAHEFAPQCDNRVSSGVSSSWWTSPNETMDDLIQERSPYGRQSMRRLHQSRQRRGP